MFPVGPVKQAVELIDLKQPKSHVCVYMMLEILGIVINYQQSWYQYVFLLTISHR